MAFNLSSLNSGGLTVVGGGQSLAPQKIQGSSTTDPRYANYQPVNVLGATTTAGGNVKTSSASPVPTGGSGVQVPTTSQPSAPAQPNKQHV